MPTQIFINLPVRDLAKARAFYVALGYRINEQFSDDTAACVVISDIIHVMLLTHAKFAGFTPKPISDATQATEVLNALSCENRAEVDERVRRAVAAGGRIVREPNDHGFMYEHAFSDPDGHIWEAFWMDPAAIAPQ